MLLRLASFNLVVALVQQAVTGHRLRHYLASNQVFAVTDLQTAIHRFQMKLIIPSQRPSLLLFMT